MPPRFKPLSIDGMNLSTGPHGDGRCDPHRPIWNAAGNPVDLTELGHSDLELVRNRGFNAVRWGLLARYLWAGDDSWEAVTTRLRPVLDKALQLGLKVIYPVWWESESECKHTLENLLPELARYPNVVPQFGPNEWMDPSGPSRAPWDAVKAQVDELAARWRELSLDEWIAQQVCPEQTTGTLGIDWASLGLHAEAWPDAYLGVALYGEDGVRGRLPGVTCDAVDLSELVGAYGARLVVTEHGRPRTDIKAEWSRCAAIDVTLFTRRAPMPRWSGCQYIWRNLYGPTAKDERFAVKKWEQGVEA